MRRNWIKLYVDQCLRGTMMDEMKDPGERFLWFAFLLLAGDSPYEGKIALTEDMGYSDEQLGSMLKCDPGLIKRAKRVMVKYDKIKILNNNIIQIVNWRKYQSEYQRQKPHRDPKFIELRESIKERDDYTCQNCQKKEEELEVPLCIHHIDSDPLNNNEDNLITLCMSCHSFLYKKAVHPTKEGEREIQEMEFKRKVQQRGSIKKFNLDRDRDKKEIRIEEDNNTYTEEFSQFWNYYNFKVAKQDALKAFKALRRKGEAFDNIMEAAKGYFNHLKNEKVHNKFEKSQKYPAGFLRNEYWKDFIGVKYKLPM